MPTFISVGGKWEPAIEKVSLKNKESVSVRQCKKCSVPSAIDSEVCPECGSKEFSDDIINPGDPFIYKGPDRAAVQEIKEQGEAAYNNDPLVNEEMVELAHRKGASSVEEYVTKRLGVDIKKEKAKSEAILKGTVISDRSAPKSKAQSSVDNTDYLSGKKSAPNGGFGDAPKL